MNRSFRKSLSVFELESLFESINKYRQKSNIDLIDKGTIHKLKKNLFEDLSSKAILLLKQSIRKIENIDTVLEEIEDKELIIAIKTFLTVKEDLEIDEDLLTLITGSEPIAFFIGTGVSNLLDIPLWGQLADKAIDYLKDECYINNVEAKKLKNEKNNPKQIISIFHDLVTSTKRQEFYEKALKADVKGKANSYELLKTFERPVLVPACRFIADLANDPDTV